MDFTFEWLVVILLQIITVAFQGYLLYIAKKKFGVEKYKDIIQKLKLSIRPRALLRQDEIIEVANEGDLVINKTRVDINLAISHNGKTEKSMLMRYGRKMVLNPADKVIIPLHEKLQELLEKLKLINIMSVEKPTGYKDMMEEMEFYEDKVKQLRKPFVIDLSIKAQCTIYKEKIDTLRKFRLLYAFFPEWYQNPEGFQYIENYKVEVQEIMGEWEKKTLRNRPET